jgi:MFS family permease
MGAGQLVTSWYSDRVGRKHLITAGMLTQAAAIALVASGTTFGAWALAQILLGAGTALVYPTLLAVIGDVAHPAWRAAPSVSTDSGATAASPSAPCSPVLSPTPTA